MAGAALLVRLDMTVGMQNRVAGKCGSAAMAAGDVFGCERAVCLRRGEARILGGQTAPSVVGAKKSPQSCGLRIQRSQLPLRDSGNTTVPRAKQNPGKRSVYRRMMSNVALQQHAATKNSPHKRRAENQLKKALSSGQGQFMKSIVATALGYALIACARAGLQQPSALAARGAAGIASSSMRQIAAMLPTIVRRCSP